MLGHWVCTVITYINKHHIVTVCVVCMHACMCVCVCVSVCVFKRDNLLFLSFCLCVYICVCRTLLSFDYVNFFQSASLVAQPSTSTGTVTMSQSQSSPDKSPKVRKVVRGNRTPEKGAFPSSHSFMTAPVVSPSGIPTHTSQNRETMTTADLQASAPPQAVSRVAQSGRRLRLGVPCPGGMEFVDFVTMRGIILKTSQT